MPSPERADTALRQRPVRGCSDVDGLPESPVNDVYQRRTKGRVHSSSLLAARIRGIPGWWIYVIGIACILLNVIYFHTATLSPDVSYPSKTLLRSTSASFEAHPLMIQLHYDNSTGVYHVMPVSISPRVQEKETEMEVKAFFPNEDDDSTKKEPCQPMHKWQTHSYVMCNALHEFDIATETVHGTFRFLACGGNRCAFKLGGDAVPLVAKLAKQKGDFETNYERTRMDSMVMERLTKSPYVVSIYGYCGVSQVTEYAQGGSIYDLIERLRGFHGTPLKLSSLDKLRIGIQIITALADLHSFEDDGITSVTHNDFDTDQIVSVDGVYKLNDFHLSHFLKRNQRTGKVCQNPMRVTRSLEKVHAPEESYRQKVDNEKADVFVAGNVMYYVLTSKWIFEGVKNQEGIRLLRKGERSPFPEDIKNSTDRADQAMMKAITMLWTHDPEERPRARTVSDFLIHELESITGALPPDGIVRVELPPLPENHVFDDGGPSWDENLADDDG